MALCAATNGTGSLCDPTACEYKTQYWAVGRNGHDPVSLHDEKTKRVMVMSQMVTVGSDGDTWEGEVTASKAAMNPAAPLRSSPALNR